MKKFRGLGVTTPLPLRTAELAHRAGGAQPVTAQHVSYVRSHYKLYNGVYALSLFLVVLQLGLCTWFQQQPVQLLPAWLCELSSM
jgi:hypothetical protein